MPDGFSDDDVPSLITGERRVIYSDWNRDETGLDMVIVSCSMDGIVKGALPSGTGACSETLSFMAMETGFFLNVCVIL